MYWNLTDKERLVKSLELAASNHMLFKDFLSDIMTEKEILTCEIRLKAMCLLYDGASYSQIRNITGFSTATIARLSKIAFNRKSSFRKIIEEFKKISKPYFD